MQHDHLVVIVAVHRHREAGRELRVLREEPALAAGEELAPRARRLRLLHELLSARVGARLSSGHVDLVEQEVLRSGGRVAHGVLLSPSSSNVEVRLAMVSMRSRPSGSYQRTRVPHRVANEPVGERGVDVGGGTRPCACRRAARPSHSRSARRRPCAGTRSGDTAREVWNSLMHHGDRGAVVVHRARTRSCTSARNASVCVAAAAIAAWYAAIISSRKRRRAARRPSTPWSRSGGRGCPRGSRRRRRSRGRSCAAKPRSANISAAIARISSRRSERGPRGSRRSGHGHGTNLAHAWSCLRPYG